MRIAAAILLLAAALCPPALSQPAAERQTA